MSRPALSYQEAISILLRNDEEAHRALELIQVVLEHLDERLRVVEERVGVDGNRSVH